MNKLIIIRGPPGSGKSTISLLVAKGLKEKTVVLPKDVIQFGFRFVGIDKSEHKSDAVINNMTKYYLENSINVVIDSVFGGDDLNERIKKIERLAADRGAKLFIINLDVNLENSLKRNEMRKKEMPNSEVKKWHNYFYKQPIQHGFILDNNNISEKNATNEIIKYIKNS